MLLNSAYDSSGCTMEQPLPYNTVETLLDDVSRQMASSNLSRRCSQKSSRPGSMRVVKTSSASNSPRTSGLNRRRTLMADYQYRRHQTVADQKTIGQVDIGGSYEGLYNAARSSRPVSWHPSSDVPAYEIQSAYLIPTIQLDGPFNQYQLPPTPAVFSGYASPASALSPTSQPFLAYEQDQNPFFPDAGSLQPSNFNSSNNPYASFIQPTPLRQQMDNFLVPMEDQMNPTTYSQFDWSNFAASGFNSATAPPTPDNFLLPQHPSPSFELEESIPYHPLEESEPTGEILVGMGLYDTPEKATPSDPQLDNYRTLLMTQLLGPAHRTYEPSGRGLKLEETWAPASDDGEKDGDDDDDAEGEDEEEDDDDIEGEETADSSPTEDYVHDIAPSAPVINPEIPEYHFQDIHGMRNGVSNPLHGQYTHGHFSGTAWI